MQEHSFEFLQTSTCGTRWNSVQFAYDTCYFINVLSSKESHRLTVASYFLTRFYSCSHLRERMSEMRIVYKIYLQLCLEIESQIVVGSGWEILLVSLSLRKERKNQNAKCRTYSEVALEWREQRS